MTTKIVSLAALSLSAVLMSAGSFAHVSNAPALEADGDAVLASDGSCVIVANGPETTECQPEAEPAPAPAPEAVVEAVTLPGDVLFDTNSDELTEAGKASLLDFIARAGGIDVSNIEVIGHADSRGSDAYNQDLSERRAQTVKDYLAAKGIYRTLVTTSGQGESNPVASNDTAAGRAQNRRVELILKGFTK